MPLNLMHIIMFELLVFEKMRENFIMSLAVFVNFQIFGKDLPISLHFMWRTVAAFCKIIHEDQI